MLGRDAAYDRVPYFRTDQYDLGMEYAGYAGPGGYDRVVIRGDVGSREFIAFWMSGNRVVAGINVNIWDVSDAIRALVRPGQPPIRPGSPTPPYRSTRSPPRMTGDRRDSRNGCSSRAGRSGRAIAHGLARIAARIIGLYSVKPIDRATPAAADELPRPGNQTS